MTAQYWADEYIEKKRDPEDAMRLIRSGQRVFLGSSSGEPQCLVRALSKAARNFTDLEVVRLMSLETTPLTPIADTTRDQILNIRNIYLGSAQSEGLARNKRFITPMNLSAVPRLFKSRLLPIHVALVQVSPPDDFGWMSLGVSVDVTLAAALSADVVIAQVNSRMPRVLGRSFIHVNDVDAVVEHDEDLITVGKPAESEEANVIGRQIARLVEDGSTLQVSLGATHQAILLALARKNDLGVHSQFLTDDMMHLVSRGVITNRRKGFNEGKLVASLAVGSKELYEFLHDNPGIEFHPSDYVNDPAIIARHRKMVAMNVAMAVDLTGQVAADALPANHFSGVSGILDFIRGAAQSPGGKSILMFTSTSRDGRSRIVPRLGDTAVVVPRGDVHYVVTEYGAVNLFGKSFQERAMAMISIARPEFRDELFHEAKEMGLFGPTRTLKEAARAVYPVKLEEEMVLGGETVTIRPAKPVDERRIQEHFYNLDKKDVVSRFFRAKTSFLRDDVESMSLIDYMKSLTLVAIVGEFGFGKIVGIAQYYLQESGNLAEVAFSVSTEWQGKGLGKILMKKLGQAARENGISGLTAMTSPRNHGMINLFKSLPYEVKTLLEEGDLVLTCKFEDRKGNPQ